MHDIARDTGIARLTEQRAIPASTFTTALIRDLEGLLSWWRLRCAYCYGAGRRGTSLQHLGYMCPYQDRIARSALGRPIYSERILAQAGCGECALPEPLCRGADPTSCPQFMERRYGRTATRCTDVGCQILDVVVGLCASRWGQSGMQAIAPAIAPDSRALALWLLEAVEPAAPSVARVVVVFAAWTRAIRTLEMGLAGECLIGWGGSPPEAPASPYADDEQALREMEWRWRMEDLYDESDTCRDRTGGGWAAGGRGGDYWIPAIALEQKKQKRREQRQRRRQRRREQREQQR